MSASPSSDWLRAYLANVQYALVNQQDKHAELLLQHVLENLQLAQSAVTERQFSSVHLKSGVGLHKGLRRQSRPNEDYTFAFSGMLPETGEHFGLFLVADGMGGHANGQDASRMVVHTMVDTLLCELYGKPPRADMAADMLVKAVQKANANLFAVNAEVEGDLDRMGTTLTAALIINTKLVVANVGDSRTYLFQSGTGLRQVTTDHSLVQMMVARGDIDSEEIYTHPDRNKITRSLGASETVVIDVFHEQLCDRDILLLCSDGMWEMTRDPKIEEVLQDTRLTPPQMTEQLICQALQGGGHDNIGVVVVQASVVDIAALSTMLLPFADLAPLPL